MLIQKAVRYRLETTPEQENLLARAVGCVRFVWNRALAVQKSYLDHQCGTLNYAGLCELLTSWRNTETFGFLAESPSMPQQQTLRHLSRALKDAFDKNSVKKFPKFKKKFVHDSMRYPEPDHIQFNLKPVDQDGRKVLPKIFLPKIGWVKFRKSCLIGGEIRNVTVSRSGGHWYVAIQIEKTVTDPVHPATSAVGGDRNVKENILALSDGTQFLPVTAYRNLQKQLAREQRKLAHKVKFSANWKKQKAKITRWHQRIAEIRKTVLHQVSTAISKNHAVVVLEDLKVRNMTASAKGTVEAPGRHIRQKSGLNKSILDQGWGMLKQMLGYKLQWAGGMLLLVGPAYTSQTCAACGAVDAGNRKGAIFCCLHCGHEAHADVNAAQNILARGLQSTAGHAGVVCSPE
ncbi:RNA-guided endonuclease InsQ/TnpB family protein [Acidithiobacillus sulfurivorans]|uniref:IS200/IS605 family element transposase accessory protein TnpB n=1 Tax=Acidithiobacillus sulfurivorans TaxID=1958756 RepID=A0ABS5ZUM8_9PROT|nr:RNA-guided endonuclease TnpB family protein [Acidithiobacillus sulfurivorans]MBU2758927.1 IS200/IS605 family element transposase accessory protein TnpB [Acidithiobacillus sulfurivorans]